MSKHCPECKQDLEDAKFHKHRSKKSGLQSYCIDCTKKRQNKESIRLYYQEHYRKNKESIRIQHQKYNLNNKDKLIIAHRKYEQTLEGKYNWYKNRAKQRKLSFNLTKEDFCSFWQKPCSYCQNPIQTIGLDRLDNHIGYEKTNCISCCKRCNFMKSNLTVEEFLEHITKIVQHLNLTSKISSPF